MPARDRRESMKKASLILGAVVFVVLIAIIFLQYITLVRTIRTIESLKDENEVLKGKNTEAMSMINEQNRLVSQLQQQAASRSEDIAKIRNENSELLTKNKELTKNLEGNTAPITAEIEESVATKKEDEGSEDSSAEAKGDAEPANQMKGIPVFKRESE